MKDKFLIGIHGRAHCGKDSFAKMLIDEGRSSFGVVIFRYGFADPIKQACNDLFGWDDRHAFGELKEVVDPKWGFSPRHCYQQFGTQFGRKLLRDDLWLKVAEDRIGPYTIIPDLRFDNEAQFILDQGGLLIHIVRPSQAQIELSGHVSEAGLSQKYLDQALLINNDSTLDKLEQHARLIIRSHMSETNIDKKLHRKV